MFADLLLFLIKPSPGRRRRFMRASLLFMLLAGCFFAVRLAHAGACVCDVPTPVGCADWCEIWSPDLLSALASGTSAIVGAIGDLGSLIVSETLTINNTMSSVGGKIVIAIDKGYAGNKTLNEGIVSQPMGKSLMMGQQTGFPGSVPVNANEGLAQNQVKTLAADGTPKICNEIMTGSQSLGLVSGGVDSGRDAIVDRITGGLSTSRDVHAQGSFNDHVNGYCSLADLFNGICNAAAPDDEQNLDVMPPGFIDRGEGMTSQMSETEKRGAQAWLDNVVGLGNYPASDFSEDVYNSDARKHFSATNNVVQARLSSVASAGADYIARRNKVVVVFNSDGSATADVTGQVTNANPNLAPAAMTAGASDTIAQCGASQTFSQYIGMGSADVNSAINNAYNANSSGFSGFGISMGAWHYYAVIESSKIPTAKSPSGYYGLYQMGAGALSDVGMSNLLPTQIYDPVQNANAAAALEQLNIQSFASNFPNGVSGVSPVFVLYGMHNMGPSGFKEIYSNITNGTPLSASRAKAIQSNMSPTVPLAQITGKMYWEFWKKKFGLTGC